MTSTRARKEDLQIIGISLTKTGEPFFDKAERTAKSRSEFRPCPFGMLEGQAAKGSTFSNPLNAPRGETSPKTEGA